MVRKMKAAVVSQFKQCLAIEEVVVPIPNAGQILLRIGATGVCHTDLHLLGKSSHGLGEASFDLRHLADITLN